MFDMGRALGQTQREITELKQSIQRLTPIEPGDLPSGGRKSRRLRKKLRRTRK